MHAHSHRGPACAGPIFWNRFSRLGRCRRAIPLQLNRADQRISQPTEPSPAIPAPVQANPLCRPDVLPNRRVACIPRLCDDTLEHSSLDAFLQKRLLTNKNSIGGNARQLILSSISNDPDVRAHFKMFFRTDQRRFQTRPSRICNCRCSQKLVRPARPSEHNKNTKQPGQQGSAGVPTPTFAAAREPPGGPSGSSPGKPALPHWLPAAR